MNRKAQLALAIAAFSLVGCDGIFKHQERLRSERLAQDLSDARAKEIEQELSTLAREAVKLTAYETLAKKSPQMRKLLAELKELKK